MTSDLPPNLPAIRQKPRPLASVAPRLIAEAGPAARYAWGEFFAAHIRNPHTRSAYLLAVRRFLAWLEPQGIALTDITPAMIGEYFSGHPGSPPTRKLHLAAIRGLFHLLVLRHVMVLNPASSVRGEKYVAIEGKTPEITQAQARKLMASIETTSILGLRDRAVIATFIFTAVRAGAVAKLRLKDFTFNGDQWTLRFEEKGGKSREIPVRLDLQKILLAYLQAAGLEPARHDQAFFRTAWRTSGLLTSRGITAADICRMVKRRVKAAGLPERLSPHSFRAFAVTDLLSAGVPLEDVQYLAGHTDVRTTRLYDRRQRRVTRNMVEKISLQLEDVPEIASADAPCDEPSG